MKVWFVAVLTKITPTYAMEFIRVYLDKPHNSGGKLTGDYAFSATRDVAAKLFPDFIANMKPGEEPIWGYLDIDFGYRKEESA